MEEITKLFADHPYIWQAIKLLLTAVAACVGVFLVLKLERKTVEKLLDRRKNINIRFVESVVRFVIILLAVEWVVMSSPLTQSFGKVLFQGTAIIGAIAGFAAQPVISDIICGLMLSATKPFDIGDRIELSDGTAGIVKDITLRHVELAGLDTERLIIPNSVLNGLKIVNMSYRTMNRSYKLKINVAYDTDVELAMAVIRGAVEESPYTVPGKPGPDGSTYGPVYFLEYASSSLVMATTVYYEPGSPTEAVKSDVNVRVNRALNAHGIEIPYDYVNVVMSDKG